MGDEGKKTKIDGGDDERYVAVRRNAMRCDLWLRPERICALERI